MNPQEKKSRMVNMELLRIVSMTLVVALHYLDKGGLLTNLSDKEASWGTYLPWLLEAFAISAVNCYMMLTGYFLASSSFKVSRLVRTLLQVWFYSVIIGIIAGCFGLFPEEGLCIHYLLSLVLPISMNHYWFMTAYVFMYLFTPFIVASVKKLNKKQMQIILMLLLTVFCAVKSIAPIRLGADQKGYDCIWYLCVCIVGVYIRLYGIPFAGSVKKGAVLWAGASLAVFGCTMAFRAAYISTGKLGAMLMVCYDYNHILTFAASLGLFGMFEKMRLRDGGRMAKWILRIAPYTLGVYLLHEHLALRYRWQGWLGAQSAAGPWLVLWLAVAMCVVMAAGIAADLLRSLAFGGLHRILLHIPPYRKLAERLAGVDRRMAEKRPGGV